MSLNRLRFDAAFFCVERMGSCLRGSIPRSESALSGSCSSTEPSTPRTRRRSRRSPIRKSVGAESLRRWVIQADIDSGERDGQTSEEAAEVKRLKAEHKRLREDVAILKAATTFFAGELDSRNR